MANGVIAVEAKSVISLKLDISRGLEWSKQTL